MRGCRLVSLVVVLGLTGVASAEERPWHATVQSAPELADGQTLTRRGIELVGQINDYFNRLPPLEGAFVQTSPGGKRERGMLHLLRPGQFRFEFAPPKRVVVISDGEYVAVQDYDLNTDDRSELRQSPFRALLAGNVDLVRDVRIWDIAETADEITIMFSDARNEGAGSIRLFLAKRPQLQIRAWITKDNQGLDTRVDIARLTPVVSIDRRLFDPSSRLERQRW
jgi:outer membrane lipoprotein-sorting protein